MRTKTKSQARIRGHWEENRVPWYEQTAIYCDACGRLIPNKQFVVEQSGVSRRYCATDCAQLKDRLRRLNRQQSIRS
jgi:hypothetical protein